MNKKKILLFYTAGILILIISILASLTYGAKSVGLGDLLSALSGKSGDGFLADIVKARIPRTIFGLLAGAALSVSGVLMQSITRNPLADPGILGVNTGAALFIVTGIAIFNIQSKLAYFGFSFAGALLSACLVYAIASLGKGGATPIKLAISGMATSMVLSSAVSLLVMPDSSVMTTYRFWQVGSIGGTDMEDIYMILPVLILSIIVSILISGNLDTLLLSEETAVSLGLNVKLTKGVAAFLGVLLSASVTALAGPIGFVGLMVPHVIRKITGDSHRHLIIASTVYGGAVLLLSDILGRILGRPGELESGIMTALIGAPVFVYIIRKAGIRNT